MDSVERPASTLFPTRAAYLAWLLLGLMLCTLFQGWLRWHHDAREYPLIGDWETYSVDPWANPFRSLFQWEEIFPGDYLPIFEAAQGLARDPGFRIYQPQQLKENRASFVYTPVVALAISPIATEKSRFKSSARRISHINHWMWIATGAMCWLLLSHGRRPDAAMLFLLLLHFLMYYPFAKALELTQASIWITFFLTISLVLLQRGWPAWAGVALAAGVSIKPHLVVVPLLLLAVPRFPRRLVIACLAGVSTAALVSLLYAGWQNCIDYAFRTLPMLSAGYAYYPNQSINGMLLRLLDLHDPAEFNLAAPVGWVKTLSSLFALALLGVALWAARHRPAGAEARHDTLCLALLLATATAASPVCWHHHMTALFAPLCVAAGVLWHRPALRTRGIEALLLSGFLLTGYYFATKWLRGFPETLLSNPGFLGMLLMVAGLCWLTVRAAESPRA